MNPYFVRANTTTVEVWSGQRIQHGNEGRDNWQRALKAELRQNFSRIDRPLFPTPAVQISRNGYVQINPADDRCWLGEYTVRQDSTSRWPELTGELFSIRLPLH